MSDQIIGTAVLDRAKPDYAPYERLFVLCVYKSGTPTPDTIPVHPKGTEPAKQPSWAYEIKGDTLHLTPSVRISTTRPSKTKPDEMENVELFHNDGSWSVKFKEFIPGDYVQPYDLFKALNP